MDTPPDLVLFETLSLVDENFTISAIEMLIEAGWPVWMSFRRCRYGVCGIHGQVRGGPEGDNFGRLANKLERCGIDASLINCQPTARVSGTIPWLRDFTNLPLGVYPNLGRHVDPNWLWKDTTGRTLSPLPLPEIVVNPGVLVPTQGSYLIWKYLLNSGVGGNSRCLDVGCGAGILAVQLALNGATEVVAIDFEKEAVANTMTNAFRNGVVESVKGEVVDPYVFDPDEKFDFIVTSLYQMPTDPKGKFSGHCAIDFWGRNLMEHFIAKLRDFLRDSGTAYVMHLSLPGQYRTASFLEQAGYQCVVLDFALYDFNSVFEENLKQIERVEQLSDAYHFKFRNDNTMVMYLLEIRKKSAAK
ncbi:MAG: methyltransferase domain-containing protein [Gammaproteobacteria bacterium]|nr:methyltransferase domain-containing protein [Gammaproteobacteria bacterium]